MTQADVNNALNQVVNNFTGERIAMPNGQYFGECTAPITWFLSYLNLPWNLNMANNRADGWGVVHPHELEPFFSFEDFQQGKAYPRGTILMWNSPHIALILNDVGGDNVVTCFEQNADPDGAPCGTHSRMLNTSSHTCTYAMVPRIEAPAPLPPPPYNITGISHKTVRINKETSRWNVALSSLDDMTANPVEAAHVGDLHIVVAIANNTAVNEQYYLDAVEDLGGWNVTDCDDYTPPPYVPPAAPVPIKKPIAYTLLSDTPAYDTPDDAWARIKTIGFMQAGDYIVYAEEKGMKQITKDNMKTGLWVNPIQNKPPAPEPEPEPTPGPEVVVQPEAPTDEMWKTTYQPMNSARKPVTYVIMKNTAITDLSGQRSGVMLRQYQEIKLYGTFIKDNVTYGRPKLAIDSLFRFYYGVPLVNADGSDPGVAEPEQQIFSTETTVAERKQLRRLTFHDREVLAVATIERYAEPIVKLIDGITRRKGK